MAKYKKQDKSHTMKVAIIFSEGMKQINFTPENEDEKQALKLITPNDDISLAVKSGSFGEEMYSPFSVSIQECNGGYLRAFDNSESIMLVLSPKENKEKPIIDAEVIAIEFTEKFLEKVDTILTDDYKTGFKEGIQKFIDDRNNPITNYVYKIVFTHATTN